MQDIVKILFLVTFVSTFLNFSARRYASEVYAVVVCPSVRPSVYHTPVLHQNG